MSTILQKSGENRVYFHSLDMLRAFAAFLVVLSHARNCFLQDYRHDTSVILKPFYFISDFGHESVIIFFVLSGCVVGRIVIRGIQAHTWSWGDYLFDRLTRLWIVLVPALGLTVILDLVDLSLAPPGSFVHTGISFANTFTQPLAERLSIPIFLGNLLYLQTIFVPTFGSNTPLWSLSNEFWYYIAFPLLLTGLTPGKTWLFKIIAILGGVMILIIAGWQISSLFPVWIFGALAFALFQKMPPRRAWIVPGLFLAGTATSALLVLERLGSSSGFAEGAGTDNLLGLACAFLVYFALGTQPPLIVSNIAGFFSKFSYTVYLLHLPLITFVSAIFIGTNDHRLLASIRSVLVVMGAVAGSYLYAYGIFLLTENNTPQIRRWLKSWLDSSGRQLSDKKTAKLR